MRKKMQKEHFAGLKSNLLDHLDIDRAEKKEEKTATVSKVTKKKITQGLDTPERPVVDSLTHGIMETNGFNMCELLNEAMEKNNVSIPLAELSKSTGLIIQEVVESLDRGKVTAYWTATEIDNFLEFAHNKDEKTARKMEKMLMKNISEMLQKTEPRFRAYLVKKMDFRRVPKIDFSPYVEEEKDTGSDARQVFLREQARDNYRVAEEPAEINNDEYYNMK